VVGSPTYYVSPHKSVIDFLKEREEEMEGGCSPLCGMHCGDVRLPREERRREDMSKRASQKAEGQCDRRWSKGLIRQENPSAEERQEVDAGIFISVFDIGNR